MTRCVVRPWVHFLQDRILIRARCRPFVLELHTHAGILALASWQMPWHRGHACIEQPVVRNPVCRRRQESPGSLCEMGAAVHGLRVRLPRHCRLAASVVDICSGQLDVETGLSSFKSILLLLSKPRSPKLLVPNWTNTVTLPDQGRPANSARRSPILFSPCQMLGHGAGQLLRGLAQGQPYHSNNGHSWG